MTEPPSPPPEPPPSEPPATAAGNRSLLVLLAYLGPLALIPLVAEKDDTEVQWHARHGLLLLIAELLVATCWLVLWSLTSALFAPLGCLFLLFGMGLFVVVLVIHLMAMVKGVKGGRLVIPGLSPLAERF
jgi:uncharacterized membrane protein